MKKMTSRERLLAAARHEPVDRLPLLLWVEPHTILSIADKVKKPRRIADRLFIEGLKAARDAMPNEDLRNVVSMATYLNQADFLTGWGSDMVGFNWAGSPLFIKNMRYDDGKLFLTDMYGAEHSMMGLYLEITDVPCKDLDDLDKYEFPNVSRRMFYQGLRACKRTHRGMTVAGEAPGVQDVAQWFMGMENLYLWMALHPEKIKSFFKKLLDHSLDIIRGHIKAGADVIMIMDDYGAQGRLLISKKMWEEFTFPCLKRQCEEARMHGVPVMLHSCGYVEPLLDKLIEAGVDMLQSFQPAAGNNFENAKKEFGDEICFVTGIDSQLLPSMTPGEVRDSVLENVRIGSEGGGFVLATNHALQVDTPVENLKMLFKTINEVMK